MKVSRKTISALVKIITGDSQISPYRSGPQLIEFFDPFGCECTYGRGFPARWAFATDELNRINGKRDMEHAILAAVDTRDFIESDFEVSNVISYLNEFLEHDDYELVRSGRQYKFRKTMGAAVVPSFRLTDDADVSRDFLREQLIKCQAKIREGDFDGAITNARSLVEAVLVELENKLVEGPKSYDGDLVKLNKRVQKAMNLEPGSNDISSSLRQLLQGLVSIINGISRLSSKMGDRHARSYRPSKHHAELLVNSATTYVNFLFDTYQYQKEKGTI